MNTPCKTDTNEVLRFLCARGVPLVHGVRLVCGVRGVALQQIAALAGVGRNHLYQMLVGTRPVSPRARFACSEMLGLDPWLVMKKGVGEK